MAIGTPQLLGTVVNNSNPANSGVITTAVTANVGDQIIVATDAGINTATFTCADSAGNTYVADVSGSRGTLVSGALFRCNVTTQLAAGGTITITVTGGGPGCMGVAAVVSGVASGAPDQTASSNGLGTAPTTGTTPATTSANEICWAFVADSATSSVLTAGGSYTKIGEAASATRQADVALFYLVVSATGTQSETPTTNWGASKQWLGGIATYPASGGGGTTDLISFAVTGTSTTSFALGGTDLLALLVSGTSAVSFGLGRIEHLSLPIASSSTVSFGLTKLGGTQLSVSGTSTATFSLSGSDLVSLAVSSASTMTMGLSRLGQTSRRIGGFAPAILRAMGKWT